MPHREIEPASAPCLSDAPLTELYLGPCIQITCNNPSARYTAQGHRGTVKRCHYIYLQLSAYQAIPKPSVQTQSERSCNAENPTSGLKGMGGDIAQLIERRTGTPLTQVQFPGAAQGFFFLESTFSADSLKCRYTPVCNRMLYHLYAR